MGNAGMGEAGPGDTFLERCPTGMAVFDRELRAVRVNAALAAAFGFAASDAAGRRLAELLPGLGERIEVSARTVLDAGQPFLHAEVASPTAPERLWLVSIFPVPPGVGITVEDAPPRAGADRALHEREATFRAIFDHAAIGMLVHDWRDGGVRMNPALQELLGYSQEELAVLGVQGVTHPDDFAADRVEFERLMSGQTDHYTLVKRYLCKGGRVMWGQLGVSLARDEARRPLLLIATIEDVTERRNAEETRAHAAANARLASLGTMAAGLAHEVNNPLTYVLLNLDRAGKLLARLPVDERDELAAVAELVRSASDGAERIRQVTHQVRTFARADDIGRGLVVVRFVLDAAVAFAEHELRHRARVVRDYREAPVVAANEGRLGQVFLNLLLNAAQAIPEGHAAANEIRLRIGTDAQGRAIVDVEDTGHGIPERITGRIFEPFFSTKPLGQGSGLGLSICHGIVSSLGGEITVSSQEGRGATFRVALPPASGLRAPGPVLEAPQYQPPRLRLLVVDDDERVAGALGRALEERHDVVLARSGRRAIDLLAADARFDAILCDVHMPEVSAMDVYDELRRSHPQLAERMIFMTGGPFTPRALELVEEARARAIEKPIDMDRLFAVLHSVAGKSS